MRFRFLAIALLSLAGPAASAQTLLLRQPSVSDKSIAFAYANNIWVVDRSGGDARRITSFGGQTSDPKLSPDGKWVAFTGQYGGNSSVYVVPVEGGEARRLTWHPAGSEVTGWTPDGRRVVFTSGRNSAPSGGITKFWTVAVEGGAETPMAIPRGSDGQYSPDGSKFAYVMPNFWDPEWRNYRGGQARPLWIARLDNLEIESPSWSGSRDVSPAWLGDTVYFLSDRDFLMNIWAYNTRTRQTTQVTKFTDYDLKSLSAGGGVLVFEQGGRIHLFDPKAGKATAVNITVRGDFPWMEPQWKPIANLIFNASLSPTGKRAVIEARGDIFTVPAEKGDWRNLTGTPGVADRNPAWSPDGKSISWFSDRSGEYRLVIAPADGATPPREIELAKPTFYYTPAWSPDSKKILFTDTGLNLWVVDVATGKATKADTDQWMVPERSVNPVWSPDSKWIAYAKRLPTQLHSIFVYDVAAGQVHQVTDGMADATWPAWDASGKYLAFLASTDLGLNTGWLEMQSMDRPVTRSLYLAVLRKGDPSPLLPESDDEAVADSAKPAEKKDTTAAKVTVIDFDGLSSRIVATDVSLRNYQMLRAGTAGTFFFLEGMPPTGAARGPQPGSTLHRLQLKTRKTVPFATGVSSFRISADGKKILLQSTSRSWSIVDGDGAPPPAGSGTINVAAIRMLTDPKAEFKQMFDEGWRFQRDFLYVPNMHGADYVKTKALYTPMLEHVRHRSDLVFLQDMMGGEVAVGHSFVFPGDLPDVATANAGLLGADYEIADHRYRIAKILTGEAWNPELRAPLAAPGVDIRVGDYVVAINGVELTAQGNIDRLLEGTGDRQTTISVNSRPILDGARRITVVPVRSEGGLRTFDWVEANRRKVDQLSGGKLAYVYLPNTSTAGYTFFNRYYFAQQDRQGAVIDERFNGGGSAADYIVEMLSRPLQGYFNNPVGNRQPFTTPAAGIWGPKVMLINESAGSGGDMLPYMFKQTKVGPLVGTKTWGGLVGIWDTPPLIDGGAMLAPRGGYFDLSGKWAIENEGVAPDIAVDMLPKAVVAGHDPQLEKAVEEALRLLKEKPVVLKPEPAPPIRSKRPGSPQ